MAKEQTQREYTCDGSAGDRQIHSYGENCFQDSETCDRILYKGDQRWREKGECWPIGTFVLL